MSVKYICDICEKVISPASSRTGMQFQHGDVKVTKHMCFECLQREIAPCFDGFLETLYPDGFPVQKIAKKEEPKPAPAELPALKVVRATEPLPVVEVAEEILGELTDYTYFNKSVAKRNTSKLFDYDCTYVHRLFIMEIPLTVISEMLDIKYATFYNYFAAWNREEHNFIVNQSDLIVIGQIIEQVGWLRLRQIFDKVVAGTRWEDIEEQFGMPTETSKYILMYLPYLYQNQP